MKAATGQAAAIRAALNAERAQVLADLASLNSEIDALSKEQNRGGMATATALAGDTTDQAEQERDLVLLGPLQRRLDAIDQALRALDHGNYGRCQRCGEMIEPGRLKVLPFANLCATCQGASERRQGGYRR